MSEQQITITDVFDTVPFATPRVRSSVSGSIVHYGSRNDSYQLRAACHLETERICRAEPTSDPVDCLNCWGRERNGKLQTFDGPTIAPHLVKTALHAWGAALPNRRTRASLCLAQICAEVNAIGGQFDGLQRFMVSPHLMDEVRYVFSAYRRVEDLPAVEELVTELVRQMLPADQPSVVAARAA